jgi:hypothetical protein
MATTTTKKAAPKKSKAMESKTGAGAAVAGRSKDAKKTFGKAAPKTVKPTAPKPAKTLKASKAAAASKPSMASRVIRKVKKTATGAVAMAASIIGKDSKPAKAKGK